MSKQINFSKRIIFCIIFNLDLDSTNLCLEHLTDKILKEFDEDLLTGIILVDLQKAIDKKSRSFFTKTQSNHILRTKYSVI